MGSIICLDGPRVGTSNPQFKVKFTKEFRATGVKFNFRIRRSPNHDMWNPLFCTVSDRGIDWSDGWNSDSIFKYMNDPIGWYDKIEIEGGADECQLQLEYVDKTVSKIYDIGKYDNNGVFINLANKKVKYLIIHPPSERQYERLVYHTAVEFDDLVVGKEYCEVKRWVKAWKTIDDNEKDWMKKIYTKHNDELIKNHPTFVNNKKPDEHNIFTDGTIFSKRRVEILDVVPDPHVPCEDSIEYREPTVYTSYIVEYGTKDHKIYNTVCGNEKDLHGSYDGVGSYEIYFVDAYKSGKLNAAGRKRLDNLFKKESVAGKNLAYNIYASKIQMLKNEQQNAELPTVRIGELDWVTTPIEVNDDKILTFSYQFLSVIPKNYRIPTLEEWESLEGYFHKHDNKTKENIYKHKNAILKIPLMGFRSGNGGKWSVGDMGWYWVNFGKFEPVTYSLYLATVFSGGGIGSRYENIDSKFGAGLMLVKIK